MNFTIRRTEPARGPHVHGEAGITLPMEERRHKWSATPKAALSRDNPAGQAARAELDDGTILTGNSGRSANTFDENPARRQPVRGHARSRAQTAVWTAGRPHIIEPLDNGFANSEACPCCQGPGSLPARGRSRASGLFAQDKLRLSRCQLAEPRLWSAGDHVTFRRCDCSIASSPSVIAVGPAAEPAPPARDPRVRESRRPAQRQRLGPLQEAAPHKLRPFAAARRGSCRLNTRALEEVAGQREPSPQCPRCPQAFATIEKTGRRSNASMT